MKKSKKTMIRVFSIVMILMFIFTIGVSFISAAEIKPDNAVSNTGTNKIGKITDLGNTVWNTVQIVVQIVAIAAIVFAGVRYMFASADDKADIKKQTVILVVGAALVFAAVPIAKFIASTANQIF